VINAFLWGALAASTLLVGAFLALRYSIPKRTLGLIMGFGAGVLLSAVAYDLVLEASHDATRQVIVSLGLFSGAVVFFFGTRYFHRLGRSSGDATSQKSSGSGLAIILGAALDGIPESIVLGLTLVGGGGVGITFLLAILLSNLPEGIAGTTDLRESGWTGAQILRVWTIVVIASAVAALAGYAVFGVASPNIVASVKAFAGGAIIAMLADSMIPEAYENGGDFVGFVTTVGFATAFGLTLLEWI
jgi:zinc transporter, ZIP family